MSQQGNGDIEDEATRSRMTVIPFLGMKNEFKNKILLKMIKDEVNININKTRIKKIKAIVSEDQDRGVRTAQLNVSKMIRKQQMSDMTILKIEKNQESSVESSDKKGKRNIKK